MRISQKYMRHEQQMILRDDDDDDDDDDLELQVLDSTIL